MPPKAAEYTPQVRLVEWVFEALTAGSLQYLHRQALAKRWQAEARQLWPDGTPVSRVCETLNRAALASAKLSAIQATGQLFKQYDGGAGPEQCIGLTNRARSYRKQQRPAPLPQSTPLRRATASTHYDPGFSGQEIKQLLSEMPDARYGGHCVMRCHSWSQPDKPCANEGHCPMAHSMHELQVPLSYTQMRYDNSPAGAVVPAWASDPRLRAERLPVTLSYQAQPVMSIAWRDVFVTKRTKLLVQDMNAASADQLPTVWARHRTAGLWFCMMYFGWGKCPFHENCFFIHADPAAVTAGEAAAARSAVCNGDCPHLREECRDSPLTRCPFVHPEELDRLQPPRWWRVNPRIDGVLRVLFRAEHRPSHAIMTVERKHLFPTLAFDEGDKVVEWCSRVDCCRWQLCPDVHIAPSLYWEVKDRSVQDLLEQYARRCGWFRRLLNGGAAKSAAPAPSGPEEAAKQWAALHARASAPPAAAAAPASAPPAAVAAPASASSPLGAEPAAPQAEDQLVAQQVQRPSSPQAPPRKSDSLADMLRRIAQRVQEVQQDTEKSRAASEAWECQAQALKARLNKNLPTLKRIAAEDVAHAKKLDGELQQLESRPWGNPPDEVAADNWATRWREADEAIAELQRDTAALRGQAAALRAKLQVLGEGRSSLQSQRDSLQAGLSESDMDLGRREDGLEEADDELKSNLREIDQLQQRCGVLEGLVGEAAKARVTAGSPERAPLPACEAVEALSRGLTGLRGAELAERHSAISAVRSCIVAEWEQRIRDPPRLRQLRRELSACEADTARISGQGTLAVEAWQQQAARERAELDDELQRLQEMRGLLLQQCAQQQERLRDTEQRVAQRRTAREAALSQDAVLLDWQRQRDELAAELAGLQEQMCSAVGAVCELAGAPAEQPAPGGGDEEEVAELLALLAAEAEGASESEESEEGSSAEESPEEEGAAGLQAADYDSA